MIVAGLGFSSSATVDSLRAAYDAARNEARRQSRYLAAHVPPTLAEKSEYPDRGSTMALVAVFLTLAWAFMVLAAYAMRDRR